jgi:acylphosphatase
MADSVRRLQVHGRVQGVGYRWAMVEQATQLGLSGWVRNRRDGSVEAMVAGAPEAVQRLIDWAQRGPPAARVTRVDVSAGAGCYTGFEQRPTA